MTKEEIKAKCLPLLRADEKSIRLGLEIMIQNKIPIGDILTLDLKERLEYIKNSLFDKRVFYYKNYRFEFEITNWGNLYLSLYLYENDKMLFSGFKSKASDSIEEISKHITEILKPYFKTNEHE